MERTRPDGVHLAWSILGIGGHGFGALVPFLIDWRDSPHPSLNAPAGLSLVDFGLTVPDQGGLSHVLHAIDVQPRVTSGPPGLHAEVAGPASRFRLETVGPVPERTFGL